MQVGGFAFRRDPQQIINIHQKDFPRRRTASRALPMMNRIITFPKMTEVMACALRRDSAFGASKRQP
jgi:hypothetical protein